MARCQERQQALSSSASASSNGSEASHDHLKWQGTRNFTAYAGSVDEEIQYSGWVEKINNRGAVQPRVMVVSNRAVYNFKSRITVQCKRRIDLCAVVHIVRSKYSHQFILCCPQEYDYLYSSVQVEEICDIIVAVHKTVTGKTILVEYKDEVDLSEYVLTRQEAKKIRKEHPELSTSETQPQAAPSPITKQNAAQKPTSSKQEKIERMAWVGDDLAATPTSKLLPENHVPSVQLVDTNQVDLDGEILKVVKVIDELYVVKNQKTGQTFALKPVSYERPSSSRGSMFSKCFQQLCVSLVFFQILIFCAFGVALKYIVKSCYKE